RHKPRVNTTKPEHDRPVLGKQESIDPDKFTASEYAKSHDKDDVTPEEILMHFPEGTVDKIAEVQARLKSIEQTIDLHKNDDGQYTDERRQLHDSILSKLLSIDKIKAATPPDGEKPTFIILGGRGGCLSADHEFLTKDGWKRIDQYQSGDEVLVFDLELNATRFEQPQSYINLPCNEFYHFKARGVDMMLSEEHTVLFNKKFNPKIWRTSSAADIVAEHDRLVEGWDGMIPCTFPAPENVEGVALSDDELRLMVAVCADGSFALDTTNHCRMALRKDRKKERLVDLLKKCGIEYTETVYDGRPTESRYGFYAPQNNKTLSAYWKATPSQLAIIADELLNWDGWVDRYGSWIYTSTNYEDINFVSYLFSSQGRRSSFYCDERENTGWRPIWRVSGAKNGGFAGIRYGQNKSQIKIVPSPDGRKYCFTVSTGFFITRRNDSVCITGNSGKSWFTGNVYDPNKFVVLDADHIKSMLPEYEGWNAHQVHEESGEIFDRAVEFARSYGLNIVLDKTMKTAKSAIADVRAFKEAGYRTEAHYMHLPRQEAAKRAVARFLGKTKRFVPPEVVLSNTTNEHSFDQVKHLVDSWSFRDNNVSPGQQPILISMKKGLEKLIKSINERIILLWRWQDGRIHKSQ
ncbi:zeta toxin family protein, partial [Nitrosomonas sp.]|uniref:zeta toxin family protein n=1 Tax=Nitrosomonas sp. TaxID=42353 RepID=UPI0026383A95